MCNALYAKVASLKCTRQSIVYHSLQPIYFEYFPSYTMLKSMRKSKNRYFHHIFVSPGDAPGAITLNVVWMEREFDAYKLPRCMCPSNYNRFWDRARYWSKIVIFSYPSCIRRPHRGVPWADLREILHRPPQVPNVQNRVKILPKSLTVWVGNTNVTDRQTDDRHRT